MSASVSKVGVVVQESLAREAERTRDAQAKMARELAGSMQHANEKLTRELAGSMRHANETMARELAGSMRDVREAIMSLAGALQANPRHAAAR